MSTWVPLELPVEVPGGGPILVGRRDHLARLEDVWTAVTEQSRQVVFIGGEPGVGKTRLATEVATTLHAQGAAVLWGATGAELDVPYRPFVTALDRMLAAAPDGSLAPILGDSAARLLRLVPNVARHRPDLIAVDAADGDSRVAMFDAVLDLLLALAERQPVVLVIEDLHWATLPTRDLLVHLVQSSARARFLIVVTHRTTAPDRTDEVTYAIADLYRHDGVVRLDLGGLGTEEVADYLAVDGGLSFDAALRSAAVLRDQTGGNPFFLRELWRDIADHGGVDALRSDGFRAPTSVRDTLDRRLAELPDAHTEVVELAAVAGTTFELGVLLDASDHPGDVTLAAVDLGVGAGLFAPVRGAGGSYSFLHALARQAVLDRMAPSRQVGDHIRIAEALERRGDDGPAAIAMLAHHYTMGHALGYASQAVRYLVLAAEHATRSLAHEEAATLYARAAELPAVTGPSRDELLLSAIRSRILAGHFAEARRVSEELVTSNDPDVVLHAAIAYEQASWRPGHNGERALELLDDALRHYPADPSDPVYVRAMIASGRALRFSGSSDRARGTSDRALELARMIGDDRLIADALVGSLWRGMSPADAPVVWQRALELDRIGSALGDAELLGPATFFRAVFAYLQGMPDEWERAHHDLTRASHASGQPMYRYVAGCGEYARLFMRGELAAAAAVVDSLDDLGAGFGSDSTEGSHGVQVFALRRARGELETIRPLITGDEDTSDHWGPGLLALYCELGLWEAAARVLGELVGRLAELSAVSALWAAVLSFLVDAIEALEDADAAARLRPLALEHAGCNLIAGQFVAVFGSGDRCLGQLDSVLGDPRADAHFERALAMDRRMRSLPHQIETLAAWARHAERAGGDAGRMRATKLRLEATALADRIGYRRVLIGLTPGGDGRRAQAPELPAGLTDREVDVLRLVADGMSNREIGERLYISQNTAANHVRSILMKTGASNRTRAAMYAAEHHLLESSARR